MKTLVAYGSKYGTTEQYASWIAQALDARCLSARALKRDDLLACDALVIGGGLYAGGIRGMKRVIDAFDALEGKPVAVFTVGLANPDETDYARIIQKNVPDALRDRIRFFHLRGGIDYKRLGPVHKVMMAMMKCMIERQKGERSEEDRQFLALYGQAVTFVSQETARPIVDFIRTCESETTV